MMGPSPNLRVLLYLAVPARKRPGFSEGLPWIFRSAAGRQGDPKDAVLLGSKADKKALRQVLQRFSKDWRVRNNMIMYSS